MSLTSSSGRSLLVAPCDSLPRNVALRTDQLTVLVVCPHLGDAERALADAAEVLRPEEVDGVEVDAIAAVPGCTGCGRA